MCTTMDDEINFEFWFVPFPPKMYIKFNTKLNIYIYIYIDRSSFKSINLFLMVLNAILSFILK